MSLRIAVLLAVVLRMACGPCSVLGQDSPRPDILWITAEDYEPDIGLLRRFLRNDSHIDKLSKQRGTLSECLCHGPDLLAVKALSLNGHWRPP